jgi:hypothetical protein
VFSPPFSAWIIVSGFKEPPKRGDNERVIYDRYRVMVVGSVPIKMQLSNSREIETRKLDFCLRGEIDKTSLHKTKPRKKFAEDGRMDGCGSWRRERPTISATTSAYPLPYITSEHSSTN